MKPTRMKWAWIMALSAASVGCAATGEDSDNRMVAGRASVATARSAEQPVSTTENASAGPSLFQLTSGQMPTAPALAIPSASDEKQAGNEFLRPPAIPDASEALQVDQPLAPDGEPLTLEMLESLACQNNPTLLQAQSQVEGELGKAIQAGLWPNPTVSYIQEQIGVESTPGEFVGGTVRQRIVTAGKLELSREKFLARTRAAEWHALEQQYRVLNDVRMHYFRARGRWELVQMHGELLKTAEDNVLTAREQYNVGQATRAQVHLANVALQRGRLDLMRAENDYREAFETLTALVGVELPLASLDTPLEGDPAPMDYDKTLVQLVAESPQLQAARSKLESDRITIRRELAEPVPDLIVEGGVGQNFEADETVAVARLSLEVPLFDWNQGTVRQAEADCLRQQGEIRRLELTLKQELARTYRNYLTALQHVTEYDEVVLPEARSAYELQLRSYKDDRIAWAEVLRTQEDYFMLRVEFIRNLIAWRESEVLMAGYLLHGGLMPPTAPPPPGHINAVPKPR